MATRVDWSSLSLRKNPLSDDFVGSSPTSRTQLALWYNGSTTGFGPVSEGSIPSGATSKIKVLVESNNNCHFCVRISNMNISTQKWQLLLKKIRSLLPYKEGFDQRTQLFIS